MISLVLIDDHRLILDGLINHLNNDPELDLKASFTSAKEALDYIKDQEIDIIITDLDMPEMSGIELIKRVKKVKPQQKIIVLSMIDEQSIINRMIKYDVSGYLMKNEAQGELITAIKKVYREEIFYNKDIRSILFLGKTTSKKEAKSIPRLSAREKEILQLVIDEYTAKEIAAKLFISEGTVITHRKHIQSKLGAKNTAGVVRIALELGLV